MTRLPASVDDQAPCLGHPSLDQAAVSILEPEVPAGGI